MMDEHKTRPPKTNQKADEIDLAKISIGGEKEQEICDDSLENTTQRRNLR